MYMEYSQVIYVLMDSQTGGTQLLKGSNRLRGALNNPTNRPGVPLAFGIYGEPGFE